MTKKNTEMEDMRIRSFKNPEDLKKISILRGALSLAIRGTNCEVLNQIFYSVREAEVHKTNTAIEALATLCQSSRSTIQNYQNVAMLLHSYICDIYSPKIMKEIRDREQKECEEAALQAAAKKEE